MSVAMWDVAKNGQGRGSNCFWRRGSSDGDFDTKVFLPTGEFQQLAQRKGEGKASGGGGGVTKAAYPAA